MKKISLLLVVVFITLVSTCSLGAAQNVAVDYSSKLIDTYWKILDSRYQFLSSRLERTESNDFINTYIDMMESYNENVVDFTTLLIKDSNTFKNFSEFYSACPDEAKPALDAVVKNILESKKAGNIKFDTALFTKEYFPGYGYSEPGFIYRRGRELDSEFLYARWEDEEKTFSQNKIYEFTVELKLVAELKIQFPNLKVLKEFGIDIGGNFVMCAKVKFETNKTLTVRTKRRFGEYKKWFELLIAKKTVWSDPEWELTGKTYQHFTEPTGEEVATSIKN
ncbi:hypothetical protein KAJ27_05450 [bacterium]|nr:hypothetical protein [bacterium]